MIQQGQFPKQQFLSALKQTKSIKSKLKPFLEAIEKMNIECIFQSLHTLHTNIKNPKAQVLLRLNSIFALKIMLSTCNYVVVDIIQTYFLNILVSLASYDADKVGKQRGLKFFLQNGNKNSKDQGIYEYGFNAIAVTTQILKAASIIKPRRLCFSDQSNDKSDFLLAYEKVEKKLKQPPKVWTTFAKQPPEKLHQKYIEKVNNFNDDEIDKYSAYVEKTFYESLKAGFPQQNKFDARQLLKRGDFYICDGPLQMSLSAMVKGKANTVLNCLNFFNDMVIAGNPQMIQAFHEKKQFLSFCEAVCEIPDDDLSLKRGKEFLKNKKYTPEEKQLIYTQFLQKLEFWSHTFLKANPKTKNDSKIAKYYEYFRGHKQYVFPVNHNLEKDIKQSQNNFQKNKTKNKTFIHEIKGDLQDEAVVPYFSALKQKKSESSVKASKSNISKEKVQQSKNKSSKELISQKQNSQKQQSQKQIGVKQQINNVSEKSVKKDSPVKESQKNVSKVKIPSKEAMEVQKKINSATSLQVEKETPGNKQAPPEQVSNSKFPSNKLLQSRRGLDFKERLEKAEKVVKGLNENEQSLKEKMQYLTEEKRYLQKKLETAELKDEEVEDTMERFFKLSDSLETLGPEYNKYASGKISYEKLESLINKINNKRVSAKETPKEEISQKKIELQKFQDPEYKKKVQKHNQERIRQEKIRQEEEREYEEKLKRQQQQRQRRERQSLKKIKDQQKKEEPLKFIKLQIPIAPVEQRVDFNSNYSPSVSKLSEEFEVVDIPLVREDMIEEEIKPIKKSVRKFNQSYKAKIKQSKLEKPEQIILKDIQNKEISPIKDLELNEQFLSKKISNNLPNEQRIQERVQERVQERKQYILDDEDQYIEGPELNPLEQSYHDIPSEKYKKQPKSFKQALSTEEFIKGGKGQSLYWLKNETQSLIKPVGLNRKNKTSRIVSVPEMLQQKNKKFQSEIKMLEENKDKKIKDLQSKLKKVQNQNSSIKKELEYKESQINSLKEQSVVGEKTTYNFLQADPYLRLNKEKALSVKKSQYDKLAKLNKNGKLLNIKLYEQYLADITTQKDKKKQLKNKELFYKDKNIEIGCMGHRQKNGYVITCYITPETQIQILNMKVNKNDNLKVNFKNPEGMNISRRKQQKILFSIDVENIPYVVPEVHLDFQSAENKHSISFLLPCAFHKFFKIEELNKHELKNYFHNKDVLRGEEVPYSKKILKNLDSLTDFLPHIKRMDDEEGEVCFGGKVFYGKIEFPLKIRIKPNQFLYIQSVNVHEKEETLKAIEFYIATLNHFLMKEISWN